MENKSDKYNIEYENENDRNSYKLQIIFISNLSFFYFNLCH